MPDFNPQEEFNSAFQEWKRKWKKTYPSTDEENARFKNFKENLRQQPPDIPSSGPLWDVLNQYADQPMREHFEYLRLDYFELDEDEDEDYDIPFAPHVIGFPVKREDGTTCLQFLSIEDYRKSQHYTKEEDQDATVKHQSTVLPVKRSSDDKDDTKEEDQDGTIKRPKIGCGGQKQGCCSDCGK